MKKINLNTSFLKLRKEEIGSFTSSEMKQVIEEYEGTGPAVVYVKSLYEERDTVLCTTGAECITNASVPCNTLLKYV
ncbi:hypothetical protein H9N25_17125 [Pedobacter riviphilus]|uniref:Uncharacterized protein n=1 Tax=Pedobacter riviphilus TaxID=2766984 RepID=A0ABX6TG87_9SPHI|nr:hypothetical protein [Pedobacter riviphilus]QNR83652.1 hypothetical protein H9N25_17125 [Pedobacter riviphilus]